MTTDKDLPTWREVSNEIDRGATPDPIAQFIFDNEPGVIRGSEDKEFRAGLSAALKQAVDEALAADRAQRVAPAEVLAEAMRLVIEHGNASHVWGDYRGDGGGDLFDKTQSTRDAVRAHLSQHLGAQRVEQAEPVAADRAELAAECKRLADAVSRAFWREGAGQIFDDAIADRNAAIDRLAATPPASAPAEIVGLRNLAIPAAGDAAQGEREAAKALEFAEYLAKGAETFLDAVNKLDAAVIHLDDEADPDDDADWSSATNAVEDAKEGVSEFARGLRTDIYEFRKRAEKARAALAARPAAAPGWKWVPLEPTEEMHVAAVRTIVQCHGNADFPPRVYRAMLAAAPSTKGAGHV